MLLSMSFIRRVSLYRMNIFQFFISFILLFIFSYNLIGEEFDNHLRNGGFEKEKIAWKIAGKSAVMKDPSIKEPDTHNKILKMYMNNKYSRKISQKITLKENTKSLLFLLRMKMGDDYKCDAPKGYYILHFKRADGSATWDIRDKLKSENRWFTDSLHFIKLRGTKTIEVSIEFMGAEGTVFLDDIILEEYSENPPSKAKIKEKTDILNAKNPSAPSSDKEELELAEKNQKDKEEAFENKLLPNVIKESNFSKSGRKWKLDKNMSVIKDTESDDNTMLNVNIETRNEWSCLSQKFKVKNKTPIMRLSFRAKRDKKHKERSHVRLKIKKKGEDTYCYWDYWIPADGKWHEFKRDHSPREKKTSLTLLLDFYKGKGSVNIDDFSVCPAK